MLYSFYCLFYIHFIIYFTFIELFILYSLSYLLNIYFINKYLSNRLTSVSTVHLQCLVSLKRIDFSFEMLDVFHNCLQKGMDRLNERNYFRPLSDASYKIYLVIQQVSHVKHNTFKSQILVSVQDKPSDFSKLVSKYPLPQPIQTKNANKTFSINRRITYVQLFPDDRHCCWTY